MDKERTQAAYPGTYQQPDPFNTNPYWSEEIMMGPHIERKKYNGGGNGGNKTTSSQRNLTSAGQDSTSVGGSSIGVNISTTANPDPALLTNEKGRRNLTSSGTDTSTMVGGSSVGVSVLPSDIVPSIAEEGKLSLSTTLSDDWNRKRYQREDEELWGDEWSRTGHKLMDAIKHAGASAGRLIDLSLGKDSPKPITDEDRHNFYFAPKNPPVNDYHPPIVRQSPAHKDAIQWMVQPPPSAKVMEGKVPVSRSASFMSHKSHASRRTTASEGHGQDLGRIVHEKRVEAKLRSGVFPTADRGRSATGRKRSTSIDTSDYHQVSDDVPSKRKETRRSRTRRDLPETQESSFMKTPTAPAPIQTGPSPKWETVSDPDAYDDELYIKRPNVFGGRKTLIRARLPTTEGIPDTQAAAAV